MVLDGERLEVVRNAPKRGIPDLPFLMWMALAKARPLRDEFASLGMQHAQPVLID